MSITETETPATETETPATETETPATETAPALNTDPEVKCGKSINLANGYKPCVKPRDHDNPLSPFYAEYGKGHASKLQQRIAYEKPSDDFVIEDVGDDEEVAYGAVGAGEQDRTKMFDGIQPKIDDLVRESYLKWLDAGKPKVFNDSPRTRLLVNPKEERTFRAMLLSAGRYHSVAVRSPGKSTPHQNGKVIIYFSAQAMQPRKVGDTPPEPALQPTSAETAKQKAAAARKAAKK